MILSRRKYRRVDRSEYRRQGSIAVRGDLLEDGHGRVGLRVRYCLIHEYLLVRRVRVTNRENLLKELKRLRQTDSY